MPITSTRIAMRMKVWKEFRSVNGLRRTRPSPFSESHGRAALRLCNSTSGLSAVFRRTALLYSASTPDASPLAVSFQSALHQSQKPVSTDESKEKDWRTATDALPPSPLLFSYRHRLETFHFTSVKDLTQAPYAPSPLRVVQDVLSQLRQLEATATGINSVVEERINRSKRSSAATGTSKHDAALALCRAALSHPLDLQEVLAVIPSQAAKTVHVAKTMGGDRTSQTELEHLTRELSELADTLVREDDITASVWVLPRPTRVVLHRVVLRSAAPLGLHVLAVEALQALRRIQSEAEREWRSSLALPSSSEIRETERKETTASAVKLHCAELPERKQDHATRPLENEHEAPQKVDAGEEDMFSLDNVLEVVEQQVQAQEWREAYGLPFSLSPTPSSGTILSSPSSSFPPYFTVTVQDQVLALQSCAAAREFDLATALYQRMVDEMEEQQEAAEGDANNRVGGRLTGHPSPSPSTALSSVVGRHGVDSTSLTNALHDSLTAMALACQTHQEFDQLRALLVNTVAAETIPVTVPLYTALLHATSRATLSAAAAKRQECAREYFQDPARREGASAEGLRVASGPGGGSLQQYTAQALAALYQKYLSVALALYRQLRDTQLVPTADTYAALIHCSAVCREPTQAFAFYHEARAISAMASSFANAQRGAPSKEDPAAAHSFSPSVYTNLLLAYHYAGYAADAKKTLEVLIEAGAPLERASFHAALASCLTLREGQEIVQWMEQRYAISPTPHTYAFLFQTVGRPLSSSAQHPLQRTLKKQEARLRGERHKASRRSYSMFPEHTEGRGGGASSVGGVEAVLTLFDIHEMAMKSLLDSVGKEALQHSESVSKADRTAEEGSETSRDLEQLLVRRYAPYVSSLTQALLRIRVDVDMDPRLRPYLTPLLRLVQLGMNQATGGCSPQCPTVIPPPPVALASDDTAAQNPPLCVAVLAADALANLEEFVLPFLSHYSLLVIPFSALVAVQVGAGSPLGSAASHADSDVANGSPGSSSSCAAAWLLPSSQRRHHDDLLVFGESPAWRRVCRFLQEYRHCIHLMSIEEEVQWSREGSRYAIARRDWNAAAAAVTLNLARSDITGGTKLYAAPVPMDCSGGRRSREVLPDAALSSDTEDLSSGGRREPPVLLVLVSPSFHRCGKYLVDFKAQVLREAQQQQQRDASTTVTGGHHRSGPSPALVAAVQRVCYHNPVTTPHWTPPSVRADAERSRKNFTETTTGSSGGSTRAHDVSEEGNAAHTAEPRNRPTILPKENEEKWSINEWKREIGGSRTAVKTRKEDKESTPRDCKSQRHGSGRDRTVPLSPQQASSVRRTPDEDKAMTNAAVHEDTEDLYRQLLHRMGRTAPPLEGPVSGNGGLSLPNIPRETAHQHSEERSRGSTSKAEAFDVSQQQKGSSPSSSASGSTFRVQTARFPSSSPKWTSTAAVTASTAPQPPRQDGKEVDYDFSATLLQEMMANELGEL